MDAEDELEGEEGGGLSWAWDFAHTLDERGERGNKILVVQRDAEEDKNNEPGTTLFVASTDDEDRAMDVVKQDWLLGDYKGNPVVCDNHSYMRVAGKAISVKVPRVGEDIGKLMLRSKWDLENPDPLVRSVGHQHINGYRSAGSVGFQAGKKTRRDKLDPSNPYFRQPVKVETWWGGEYEMAGMLFERNMLLEFSSATVPMNPKALQRSLFAELGLHEPEDIDGRLAVVGQTVPRSVAADLGSYLADPANRKAAVDLLWPDLLERIRSFTTTADLSSYLKEPANRKAVASLLWPEFLEIARADKAFRHMLLAVIDSGPGGSKASEEPEPPSFLALIGRALET